MFLLEFPQNLIGFLAFVYWNKWKKRPYKAYRDALVVHVPGRWGAITLGRYIFADDRYYPSLIWAGAFSRHRRKHQKDYFSFYTEAWANRLEESDTRKQG